MVDSKVNNFYDWAKANNWYVFASGTTGSSLTNDTWVTPHGKIISVKFFRDHPRSIKEIKE